jgi:hypothetical protein
MRLALVATLGALTLGDLAAQPLVRVHEIITIRPTQTSAIRQGLPQFVGISGANNETMPMSRSRWSGWPRHTLPM